MKFTTLLPVKYNDGTPVKPARILRLIEELGDRFGGYTEEGEVRGVWCDDDGVLYHDTSVKVSVVCDSNRLIEAMQAVLRIGRRLEQKAMYFEVSGYDGTHILPVEGRSARLKIAKRGVSRSIATKAKSVLAFAEEFAKTAQFRSELNNALYAPNGLINKTFTKPEQKREFRKTKEYRLLVGLIVSLPSGPKLDEEYVMNVSTGQVKRRIGAKSA